MKSRFYSTHKTLKLSVIVLILLLVTFYLGYLFREREFKEYLRGFKPVRQGVSEFPLINPLVGIDSPNAFDAGLFMDTKYQIKRLIRESKSKGLVEAGIYYRDLNSSIWFGMQEENEFVPASLLKMTYALAAYKEGEDEPLFLDTTFPYTQAIADEMKSRSNANDITTLVVGQSYSTRELIKIMLKQSDNGARDALQRAIKSQYVNEVFTYLGIQEPEAVNNFQISTTNYALFFRLLYSSTFINEAHSQELLSILTKTDFPYGIKKALPFNLAVAHKWGVYNFQPEADGTTYQELHDCGIVYLPQMPYLICIMTKGTNQEVLANFIAETSNIIYSDIIAERK